MFKGLKFESVDAVREYQELLEEEFDFGEEEETSLSIVYTLLLVVCSCNMLYLWSMGDRK